MELFQPRFCRGKKKKCISCLKTETMFVYSLLPLFLCVSSFHVLHVHIAPLWGPQSQSRPHQEVDPTSDEKTVQCVQCVEKAMRREKCNDVYIHNILYIYILIYIPWIQNFLKGLLGESNIFPYIFHCFPPVETFFHRLRPHPSAPLVASPVAGFTGMRNFVAVKADGEWTRNWGCMPTCWFNTPLRI